MGKVAVEIKNYSFRYSNAEKWVLEDVNFTLNYGELAVVAGISGAGKSTLLLSINGIIPYIIAGEQKGAIYVDGENIKGQRPSEISRKIGSVLQNPDSQIINSKVEDEIAFGCENINMPPPEIEEQIENACRLMELDKCWFTKTLSGGQKQRLMTAAILAMQQKILIFDEPLANLDHEGAYVLLNSLKALTQKGYAVLLVEHRLDAVKPYADKIAWLEDGKVKIYSGKEKWHNKDAVITYNGPNNKQNRFLEPCFVLKEVSYAAAGKEILENLNFTVYKGERVVILGDNGCGKTTLLKLLARIIKPTEGFIEQYIEKNVQKKLAKDWFHKIGFVYQNPNYQLFMPSVLEEISYQAKGEQAIQEAVKRFGLEELQGRHPQSLSEGQKRRLTIACVAAMEPEVILLDEPTVGQDYKNLQTIVENLNEIHEKNGNTMVTITHDQRCAAALADKVIWLQKGKIFKIGGPELAAEYFGREIRRLRSGACAVRRFAARFP